MNKAYSNEFEDLLEKVIDGLASDDERRLFAVLLKNDESARARYAELMRIHALLRCRFARKEVRNANRKPRRRDVKSRVWWKAAAAAMIAVALGAGMWKAEKIRNRETLNLKSRMSSINAKTAAQTRLRLEEAVDAEGLSPADAKLGVWCQTSKLKLASGRIRFRLTSGAEITLLGPAEMTLRDGMEVCLETGRLLANVPPSATGSTVHAPGLTAWDLGTVFGAMTLGGVSDVLVFKGRVQVTDGEGDAVGLCEEGQGARARLGYVTKTEADWDEAEKLFASVKGNLALKSPVVALSVAGLIGDLWQERYLPEVESSGARAAKSTQKKVSIKTKAPLNKKAWVRPSGTPIREKCYAARSRTLMDFLSADTTGTVSKPIQVESSPCSDNRRWETVFTNEVPLRWDWGLSATRARLEMLGMNTSFVTNFTRETTTYVWHPFSTAFSSAEDVYDLRLTFYDANDAVENALTSRLAVVTGAFGKTVVDTRPMEKGWGRSKENRVVPYDAYWTEETAHATNACLLVAIKRNETQTNFLNEISGYYGCKLTCSESEGGTVRLALTFSNTSEEKFTSVSWRKRGIVINVR